MGKKKRERKRRKKEQKTPPTAVEIIASHIRLKTGISEPLKAQEHAQGIINDLSKFGYFVTS
jgi:hypothetical protein